MTNSKIKVAAIKRRSADLPSTDDAQSKVTRIEAGERRMKTYSKITDDVAGSDLYLRNEPIPKAMEIFPMDWKMRYSDLFYPNAKGGAVYIDTPIAPYEVNMCEIKYKTFSALGIRYTYLGPGEGAAECKSRLDSCVRSKTA